MRPSPLLQVTSAQLRSRWCPLSYYQNPFSVSLLFTLNADATGASCKVQHTMDDPQRMRQPTSLTRSGTTATVVDSGEDGLGHRLATGDCVMVFNSGDANLNTAVGFGADVTVVDKNTFTYVVANTGAAAGSPNTQIITLRCVDHADMTAMAARKDGNYAFPVRACRLFATTLSAGGADLEVTQGGGR